MYRVSTSGVSLQPTWLLLSQQAECGGCFISNSSVVKGMGGDELGMFWLCPNLDCVLLNGHVQYLQERW